jgi:hypothetical protein
MANRDNIEISKEGVKGSYLRLLSDSVSGFIVIFFGLAIYYLPIFDKPLREVFELSAIISTETKILLIIMSVISATPLGLAINAFSWFALGWFDGLLQKIFWRGRNISILRAASSREVKFDDAFFCVRNGDEWVRRTSLIRLSLEIYKPEMVDDVAYLRGLSILFRNIGFLLLIYPLIKIILIYQLNLAFWENFRFTFVNILIYLLTFFISFILSVLVAFHYNTRIYNLAYLLFIAKNKNADCDDKEFIKRLAEIYS